MKFRRARRFRLRRPRKFRPATPSAQKLTPEQRAFIASPEFLKTPEWRRARYDAIKRHGARCMACGRTPQKHGIAINVDHIKNRRDYPELALDPENVQILCDDDNAGKGNRDSTDWRRP